MLLLIPGSLFGRIPFLRISGNFEVIFKGRGFCIEMAMVKDNVVPEPSWLREGKMAEYRAEEAGYEGSWFAVKIVKLYYKVSGGRKVCHQAYVQYRDFTVSDEPDSDPFMRLW